VLPLLARPASLRYLARSLLKRGRRVISDDVTAGAEVAQQPARALIRRQPVICRPEISLREAAERMVEAGASSVLARGDDGMLGIVTDSDLRSRVVAGGMPVDAPVSEVMTAPVITVGAEQTGADVMLAMLDNDVRHVPVVSPRSEVLGVIVGIDLVAAEAHTPFVLRRAIAEARTKEELRDAAGRLHSTVVALHRAGLRHAHVSQVISVVGDALIRRMIELAIESEGPPLAEFAWLSLGSHGRREPMPSSDVDSGMAWRDEGADPKYMHSIAVDVADCLEVVGWRVDAHGVNAAAEFGASSIGEWRAAIPRWLAHAADNRVLIATSVLLDGRVVYGPQELNPKACFYESQHRTTLLRWLLRLALAANPPTGFMRDIVVQHSGEHRGTLDIKHGGLLPIQDLARYAAFKADANASPTLERLRAAGDAGTLGQAHARTLAEAFDLFATLRLEHQAHQIEQGIEPDEHLDPKQLNSLTRRYLRDAFREVAAVQKSLGAELRWTA
jgi:CBS domain-containing protein